MRRFWEGPGGEVKGGEDIAGLWWEGVVVRERARDSERAWGAWKLVGARGLAAEYNVFDQ